MYYDLGHVYSNLGEFQYRFVMQKFRFSIPPLLPRFPSSNVISTFSYRLCTMEALFEVTTQSRKRFRTATYEYFWSISFVFMYSWVYNGAPQPCFSRCMVDRPDDDHFCFPFYMGSCARRLNLLQIFKQGRTSSDFNENQPEHQNRNFLKTFHNYLWWNLYTPFI